MSEVNETDVETHNDDIDRETAESLTDTIKNTLGDDLPDGMSFGVRMSGPPRMGWDQIIKPKFGTGDLVVHSSFNDDECEDTVWAMKVCGLGAKPDTYHVKNTGSRNDFVIEGHKIKEAPDDAKWESYEDQNSPFNIPGFKVTVPSNSFGKKKC